MTIQPWKQELYHHGILGMRWGKRNGPPYPLSPGDHSASEKKAGWRKSLDKSASAVGIGGGGGGGGSKKEDEEILRELYAELEKEAKRLGTTPLEMLSSQSFRLTLNEQTGMGDYLSPTDLERIRSKAFNHYSNNLGELSKRTGEYAKNEYELAKEKQGKNYIDDIKFSNVTKDKTVADNAKKWMNDKLKKKP